MMDANQVWDVDEAIANMARLAEVDPYWIEEPTHADDVLGHARIAARGRPADVRVATGEVAANRVIFKQLLQADAIGVCQIDACRVGGVNEVLAEILLAAKFGVPVCPHAGGVGLCEYVQHLAIFDYLRVGTLAGRAGWSSTSTTCTSTSSTRCAPATGRYLLPDAARLQRDDEARVDRRVLLPGRPGMAVTDGARGAAVARHRWRRLPRSSGRARWSRPGQPCRPGIVHLGLGAFHRAHQAVYTEAGDRARPAATGASSGSRRARTDGRGRAGRPGQPVQRHHALRRRAAQTRVVGALAGGRGTRPATRRRSSRCSPTRRSGWSR